MSRSTPTRREIAGFLRPESLRFKALLAVVAMVLAPLLWVWGARLVDHATVGWLRYSVGSVGRTVARKVDAGDADLARLADVYRVRLRVLGVDGGVLLDEDGEGRPRWHDPVSRMFFGPEGRPDPAAHDAASPPPARRPEVRDAQEMGAATRCEPPSPRGLLRCADVRRVEHEGAPAWLHVQASVTRSVRPLYEDRFQLLQLTLTVLLGAVVVTIWLGTRWIRPLESLRDQALARTSGQRSLEPLELDRGDELGELADAFNTLLRAIGERDRNNEAFAADLAHELKNPLAAIRTAADALAPGRPLTEARAARLHRILSDSSARMTVVVERFLELARAEAGLADQARLPTDLGALARELSQALAADPRHAGVTIVCDAAPALVAPVMPERIETALRNLLANAAAFAGPEGRVSITVAREGGGVRVSVEDSGPGIAEDDLPRVFDRYFSRRQGGTGLGLALSRAIARAHGGELDVDRSPTLGGARFVLWVPTASVSAG